MLADMGSTYPARMEKARVMVIWAKVGIIGVSAFLWYLGGQGRRKVRLIAIPLILGLSVAWFAKTPLLAKLWLFALVAAGAQTIRCGYGSYDPENDPELSYLARVTHDRQGCIIRLIWGALVSLAISAPLAAFGVIPLHFMALYCISNCLVNFSVSKFKFPVLLTDLLVSSAVMSIIFYL
jgi:hypothetical protein